MPEPLHLIKLCVGADSAEDLRAWQAERIAERAARGEDPRPVHVTRMWPKRAAEIAGSGSLYWVIRGMVLVRQKIAALEERTGEDGIRRCAIVLEPPLVAVEPRPKGPFQGWRYLAAKDAPRDLASGTGAAPGEMPESLRRALADLGVFGG